MFGKQATPQPWDAFFESPAISFDSQPRLRELFECVARGTEAITIFLGAGVSIDSGLPTWTQLVDNLASAVKDARWAACIKDDAADPMRKAEYILQLALEGRAGTQTEIVRSALYKGQDAPEPGSLVDAIARLATMLTPTRVRVLTTNFDVLFESALRAHSPSTPVISCSLGPSGTRAKKTASKNSFLVHHVHGVLAPNEPEQGPLVLTESHFLEHGTRVRAVIEDALIESQVIFVGVSLTDPNLVTPLWKLRNLHKPYREPYVITVAAAQPDGSAEPSDARAFAIRKATYLEKQLKVRTLFLKAYSQVPQLFHELALAVAEPDRYFESNPAQSTRYGHRLAAILGTAYTNIGCGPDEELPTGQAAIDLSAALHSKLYAPDTGLVGQLRDLAASMLKHNNSSIKKLAQLHRDAFESEQFGLFLWLRSRGDAGRRSEYDLRLVGTSVYTHSEPWSLDREAPIVPGSRFDAANAAFSGQTHIQNLDEHRPWQLWRTGVAVPFFVTAGRSSASLPGTGLHLDVMSIGVIALHTRNTILKAPDGSLGERASILGALQPEQLTEVFTKLAEIGTETVGFAP